jgi:SAM-dependent methyltransferase
VASSTRTRRALELFAPLGPSYERYARVLSLGQDPRWRRFLVSRIEAGPGEEVLDVATGTGAVARELLRQKGCGVVGVDQSPEMLVVAREHLPAAVKLVEASAESLPFDDASFDALTFTYLLRYVDDPGATLRELARVVRPGGRIVVTLPYADAYREDWRDSALYVDHGGDDGRHFFGRWYDAEHADALRDAVAPALVERGRRLARLSPMAVNRGYERFFPFLVPLGWAFPLLVHEVDGPGGDMLRVTYVKRGA